MTVGGSIILFSLLILATLVANSYQLECYACREGDFAGIDLLGNLTQLQPCGNFSDSLLKTCSGTDVCLRASGEYKEQNLVAHICGPEAGCSIVDGSVQEEVTLNCISCNVDKCNSASGIAAAAILLILSLITALLH